MTMTSSRRVLKSADVSSASVLTVESPAPVTPEEPLLFTASETEALCETARQSGADEAVAGLTPLLTSIASSLEELASQTPEHQAHALRADSTAVVESAIAIARWVLGQELADPTVVAVLVEQALAEHEVRSAQRIRVAPQMVDELSRLLPQIDIVRDETLTNGSFRIQTDGPNIAMLVDATLERARVALLAEADGEDLG